MTTATSSAPVVLDVNDLVVSIGNKPDARRIIDGVSMQVRQGETLCVVGESGSGKSVTSLTVMGLLPKKVLIPTRGKVTLAGEELADHQRFTLKWAVAAGVVMSLTAAATMAIPFARF